MIKFYLQRYEFSIDQALKLSVSCWSLRRRVAVEYLQISVMCSSDVNNRYLAWLHKRQWARCRLVAGGQLWQFGDIVVTGPQRGAAQPARPAQFVTWRYWYYIHTPINHLNFPLHQERCQQNFVVFFTKFWEIVSLGTSISISMILQCESTKYIRSPPEEPHLAWAHRSNSHRRSKKIDHINWVHPSPL